eukprot:gb/GFBE01068535.1/.p1 GENE.gb/GFBE01068535.1/~~gb/GFBE01068535.1/.p1  ORF type:complete len:855 (+),score=139.74 gb/GFBE01068535.1/:1-2565(+)
MWSIEMMRAEHRPETVRSGSEEGLTLNTAAEFRVRVCLVATVATTWMVFLFVALVSIQYRHLLTYALHEGVGISISILLVCVGMPEYDALPPRKWVRILSALVVLAIACATSLFPWVIGLARNADCTYWYEQGMEDGKHRPWDGDRMAKNRGVWAADTGQAWYMTVLTMIALCRDHVPSRFARCSVRFLLSIWLEAVIWMAVGNVLLCGDPKDVTWIDFRSVGRSVCFFINATNLTWFLLLVVRRVKALEIALKQEEDVSRCVLKKTNLLILIFSIMSVLNLTASVLQSFAVLHDALEAYTSEAGWLHLSTCVCMAVSILLLGWTFYLPLQILASEARSARLLAGEQALWALGKLQSERNVILFTMVLTMLDILVRAGLGLLPGMQNSFKGFMIYIIFWDLRNLVDATTIAFLNGFLEGCDFSSARSFLSDCTSEEAHGIERAEEYVKLTTFQHPASHDPGWAKKAEELSYRGFKADHLLDFLDELLQGQLMPDFEPERSTTNDVVRRAIIPASRDKLPGTGGRAMSTVWSSEQALPLAMVTHNWTNKFLHLVAAIIADALGITTFYEEVLSELASPKGIQSMRERLSVLNTLDNTYWVCAFCINQHASICGGFGPEPPRNTLEWRAWDGKRRNHKGEIHPLCNCQQRKFFSNSPVECEMNKFDDMIQIFIHRVNNYRHVVAMDEDFHVLNRIWCIAELVQTEAHGVPLNTLIMSMFALDENYHKLSDLDVRRCDATDPQDKEFILSKIEDVSAFNARLQFLVFSKDGIFNRQINCPRDRVMSAGRIAARVIRSRTKKMSLASNDSFLLSLRDISEVSESQEDSSEDDDFDSSDEDSEDKAVSAQSTAWTASLC